MNDNFIVRNLKKKPFVIVEKAIVYDTKHLNIYDKMVYVVLCSFADNDTQQCFPSIPKLAEYCGCSVSTVKRSLKRLEKLGLIHIEQRQAENGRSETNVYTILELPAIFQEKQRNSQQNPPENANGRSGGVLTEPVGVLSERGRGSHRPGEGFCENHELYSFNYTHLIKNNDDDNKAQPKENGPNAFRFYEENFYPVLSSVDIEVLNYWLDRFSEEIVLHAMKRALKRNARNLAYVEKILITWEQHKVKSLEDVERLDRQHELEKLKKRGGVVNGSVHQHRGSDGRSSKEDKRISHYEPGKWDDVDLSLEGLL
ncbi:DnaD domain protein [Geobacillus thermodenitrificans]|uniref:DnaD domain protein n=1 Tax=Geobacillus thermodenitrificans TaxID=33940 RepID=UPI002E221FF5|nr:DnaD domain protein [Geobacillus thermodenitrificans]MED4917580.1 DnaD domain protein [Geobacillus thermodenitrificans]